MNAIVEVDQFSAWREALRTGKPVEYTKGQPTAGYYKRRARNTDRSIRWDAVGIWKQDDEWRCYANAGFVPTYLDEIEELFVSVNSTPISYELFTAVCEGGAWPEDVALVEPAPDMSLAEAAANELKAQQKAAKDWILALGRKPQTQAEADLASNYAEAFGKIENAAKKAHKAEKEPFLEGGRAVDAKWKPTIESAETAKKWAKSLSDEFAIAETARRKREADEANRKAQAEFAAAKAKADAEEAQRKALEAKGVVVPEFAPAPIITPPKAVVAEPVRVGTGSRRQSLRKLTNYEITDATALLHWLADRNTKSEDLLGAALKDAKACIVAGLEVPGARSFETEQVI